MKSGGTGSTVVGNDADFSLVNSGRIEAETGTLSLGGLNSFQDGTVFSGAGVVTVSRASSFAGGGEIRGFLVPEPATGTLLAAGLLSVLAFRRKQDGK